jgi:hypothetical protein
MMMHLVLIILIVAFIYVGYILYCLQRFWWAQGQAEGWTLCPVCHSAQPLQYYLCNHCSTVNDLMPTEQKVFYGNCTSCGCRLPKLPKNGRNDLIAVCNHHNPVVLLGKNAGQLTEIIIPLVGNNSTGKTAFLTAWTVYAQTQLPRKYAVEVSFPFSGGADFANKCKKRFAAGANVERTSNRMPPGIGMDIISRHRRRGLRVYFYDPAGEVFDADTNTANSLESFHYYNFMDACLFFIDPFATPGLRHRYNTASTGIAASEKSIEDGCEKFIRGLYTHDLARDEYHYARCAVVITKADAFDLDSQIGDAAVKKRLASDTCLEYEDALNDICEEKLKQWGMGHVQQLLEEHFKEVRYFSVSSYGHQPKTGVPFQPQRVELPVLWLLGQSHCGINF